MYPYQQQQPASPGLPPPTSNPYEFIMNPQKPQKAKGAGSMARMLLFIAGGATLLVVTLVILVNVLSGGKSTITEDLVSIVQAQNELIRVSHTGTTSGVQQATKSLAVTTEYAIQTQQNATIAYLAQHGRPLAEKEAGLKQNARTDQQFALAKSTSTFDLVFSQVMEGQLNDYAASLKQVFKRTTNADTKAMLSDYYSQTQLLISQVPYTQQKIQDTTNPTQ